MGKHRLMTDFYKSEDVRFMCHTGELFVAGTNRTVAALILENTLDVGEPWGLTDD